MKIKSEQLQRITHMEQLLREATDAVSALDQAIEGYRGARKSIVQLRRYYEGSQWMEDFKADEDGELPPDLPRGVLTEDAIYDLLTDQVRLREVFRELQNEI
jgi:exonuclease V gamma subunit